MSEPACKSGRTNFTVWDINRLVCSLHVSYDQTKFTSDLHTSFLFLSSYLYTGTKALLKALIRLKLNIWIYCTVACKPPL